MIGSTRTLRVWAYPAPADLRKGFDGLCGLVTQLRQDPLAGDCFLFVNRLRDQVTLRIPFRERDRSVPVASAPRQNRAGDATGEARR